MMAGTTVGQGRRLPAFPTALLKEQLQFALLVWVGFVAFILAVILGVAAFRGIEVSGWDQGVQAVPWYALFIGFHLGWSVLALYITHGRTRREFMAHAVMFTIAFAAALSALVTVTFVLEASLYRLAGWPQEVDAGRFYTSAMELHLVFLQSWLVLTLWVAGGIFIASAWYRHDGLGVVAVIAAILIATVSGIAFSGDSGPFVHIHGWIVGDETVATPIGVLVYVACIALVTALTWPVVRDIPIRNKAA